MRRLTHREDITLFSDISGLMHNISIFINLSIFNLSIYNSHIEQQLY